MRAACGILLLVAVAAADALVVTRAMKAETITEIFIEPGRVRVELEIGVNDFKAFAPLLPEELREKLDLPGGVTVERMKAFFREEWVVLADGEILDPLVRDVELTRRVLRDEVTGERIGGTPEYVFLVNLEYPLAEDPKALTFRPPQEPAANIGFVAYHDGVAVNDFRYLPMEATVDLDWKDAWHSRFRHRNLRRRFDSPLQVFLYVDHFEVRVEVICRPRDLVPTPDVIHLQHRASLTRQVVELLERKLDVTIDGKPARGELDRVHFVRRTLRMTGVVPASEDLLSVSAIIGAIFVFPIEGLPQEAKLKWQIFPPGVDRIPAVATDEASPMPSMLTREDPVLTWQNFLKNATRPELTVIAAPPRRAWLWPGIGFALLAASLATRRLRVIGVGVVAAIALWYVGAPGRLDEERSRAVAEGLLQNVYRAFDYRGEDAIYDTLHRSVTGELLASTYLEMRRGLVLKNQGGASAKVKRVEITKSEAIPVDGGFFTNCAWIVDGAVGHWGHIHTRKNRYEALLTIQPVDGVWKIVELELLTEERL